MAKPSATPAREHLRGSYPKLGPVEVRTVLGKPITVGERQLTPEVRVTSFVRRSGVVGTRHFGGWGVGTAHLRPLAVLETTTEGTR
ncbi:MAG: hypothetical protein SVX38_16625, partial [Chloroflexota bacterium]|nr:hypothetical protein [Chloroflexota bacterium]